MERLASQLPDQPSTPASLPTAERGGLFPGRGSRAAVTSSRLQTPSPEQIDAVLSGLSHPGWTLGELFEHIEGQGSHAEVLRDLRLGEFVMADPLMIVRTRAPGSGPGLHQARLEAAKQASGPEFDAFVREVLGEARAGGKGWAGASYLRSRVGGPRWKLQAALGRLMENGAVERVGKTSSTRYRLRQDQKSEQRLPQQKVRLS